LYSSFVSQPNKNSWKNNMNYYAICLKLQWKKWIN
jgi:hypothetical protein